MERQGKEAFPATGDYDVVIVGASIAGCSAAMLYAREGLRVALVERHADAGSYKKVCTHFIQACATPTLKRLGLSGPIEDAGGVRNHLQVWTRYGWILPYAGCPQGAPYHGYNIRRQTLDPLLRGAALATPGVDFYGGYYVRRLASEGGRISGVFLERGADTPGILRSKLVVGADGRESQVAKLAGARESRIPNRRVFLVTYFKDLPLASGKSSQLWFLDPCIAYAFPCDGGLTLLCLGIPASRFDSFKADLAGNFLRVFETLDNGPCMSRGERVSEIRVGKNMDTIRRRVAREGVALVGDAAMAGDPYAGIGVGWAFQGAEWLVDTTAPDLKRSRSCLRSVRKYQSLHSRRLFWHARIIASYSSCRGFRSLFPPEKLFFFTAARNRRMADHLDAHLNRVISIRETLAPSILLHAFRVLLREVLGMGKASQAMGLPQRIS